MVALRRNAKRSARGSSSAAKSTNPARSKTTSPIPVNVSSVPPIPVNVSSVPPIPVKLSSNLPNPGIFGANHTSSTIPVQSFGVPISAPPQMSSETFAFDGIQYSPYFLNSGDNPGSSIISEVLDGTKL